MKQIIFVMILLPSFALAQGTDYWSMNKTMNMPSGVATTSCDYFNNLDENAQETKLVHEIHKRWLKGWVSSFAMYGDWGVRDIEETEYLPFLQEYCSRFPTNTIGMAAHTFTYRVKE